MQTKILIVEDERALNKILADYIKAAGYIPVSVYDGGKAVEICEKETFALILLDVMLPKLDGYEVCRQIKRYADTPVIMLTAKHEEYDQLNGFDSGADDYVTKPFSASVLMVRIQKLLKRSGNSLDDLLEIPGLQINCKQHLVLSNGEEVILTPKEFDLLKYLILNKGITLTRTQLLDAVWGKDCFCGERTVDTHIKCLRSKLGAPGECIHTIIKIGYKLDY